MKTSGSDRIHEKIINRLERQERQEAFRRDKFFRFKLPEIHSRLNQTLLMERVIETDNAAALSDALLRGLKKVLKMSEFDLKYFVAPIRNLVAQPNPISLYITQFLLEVVLNEPYIIDVYGTDEEIYRVVNDIVTQINLKFERAENEIMNQLAKNKSLTPGSRDYEIALDQLFRKKMGEPQV